VGLLLVNETERLRERIESFPRWHYEFDLNGVRTPIFKREHANRHAQRKRYFFAPLVQLCGGSLAGKRVLDLGCNAGFWSLSAIEAGAEFVLGVDGRQMHIDQANLVFEVKGVEASRYRFELADVFGLDLTDEDPFDIVLCLGLLYHVSKPFELMERISAWSTDLLVIDTTLDPRPGPYFRIRRQNLDDPRAAVDLPVALHPSKQAVARLAREFGFRDVKMLRPRFTDWEGSGAYRRGTRRAFVCAKHTSLNHLDSERIERSRLQRASRRIARAARRARRRARRRAARSAAARAVQGARAARRLVNHSQVRRRPSSSGTAGA
jgi:SAM-dependent methyltransferase